MDQADDSDIQDPSMASFEEPGLVDAAGPDQSRQVVLRVTGNHRTSHSPSGPLPNSIRTSHLR
mgnify:CR=1 FL=1